MPNTDTSIVFLSHNNAVGWVDSSGAIDKCANCGAGVASFLADEDGETWCVICVRHLDSSNGVAPRREPPKSAVVHVLRYKGPTEALKELTVHAVFIYMAREMSARKRYSLHAICPWCGQPTKRERVSWVRTLSQRWRLECPQRHAVNLAGASGYPEFWW